MNFGTEKWRKQGLEKKVHGPIRTCKSVVPKAIPSAKLYLRYGLARDMVWLLIEYRSMFFISRLFDLINDSILSLFVTYLMHIVVAFSIVV